MLVRGSEQSVDSTTMGLLGSDSLVFRIDDETRRVWGDECVWGEPRGEHVKHTTTWGHSG